VSGNGDTPGSPQPPRPRRTPAGRAARRAQIRRRRLIALAAVVALVAVVTGVTIVAKSGGGAPPSPAGGPSQAKVSPTGDRSASAAPKPRASINATASPTSTALPTPTARDPLRFFVGGDSMGGDLGNGVAPLIYDTGRAKAVAFHKVSSGLVRTDFYDWFAYLRKYGKRYQAVAFMIGGNDAQGIAVEDGAPLAFGTRAWKEEYRRRVGEAMDIMLDSGVRRVYWVGLPVMRDANMEKDAAILNAAYRDEAEKRAPAVQYIDTAELFSTNGAYDARWRQDDGVHMNVAGVQRLAEHVAGIIEKEWKLVDPETKHASL